MQMKSQKILKMQASQARLQNPDLFFVGGLECWQVGKT